MRLGCSRARAVEPAAAQVWVALLLAILVGASTPGCLFVQTVSSEPGIDVSSIRPGVSREQVEKVVGAPLKQWTTSQGVRYSLYRYYGGMQPNAVSAGVVGFADVISLGMFELINLNPGQRDQFLQDLKKYPFMAVSYDPHDVVIGVFPDIDEFAMLPSDGRAPASHIPSR